MKLINLKDNWSMRQEGKTGSLDVSVPTSVADALIKSGALADPYYRDNEKRTLAVFDENYVFSKRFSVPKEAFGYDRLTLVFEMLDTLCDISLNGKPLASTDNMFRRYEFEVKDILREGENELELLFRSPTKYIEEHKLNLGKPYNVIRKAGCMFGWDWGIKLPDSGIYKDVYISAVRDAKISEVEVRQKHESGKVTLDINVQAELFDEAELTVTVLSPNKEKLFEKNYAARKDSTVRATIEKPQLWWPRGYGEQPLYRVETRLRARGEIVDKCAKEIGLRTIYLNREKDGKGHKYEFVVNGVPVYFKGENMIISDAIVPRITRDTYSRLIDNCVQSNLNGIRVWGGAYYPDDCFYELCDKNGLLVYQDFMFACTFYYPSKHFIENVRAEASEQIKRIRHHASLALLCGNNELDCIFTTMTSKESRTVALRRLFKADKGFDFKTKIFVRAMYSKVFLKMLPRLVRTLARGVSFTHSTPTGSRPLRSKSMFDYLWDGDMHYYLQYDGNAPYQYMREVNCRFMAEMGFQSYPSIKTVNCFTEEGDRSPYSEVMYSHQKCFKGNETIEEYMARDYLVPKKFENYVYLSQLQAGEIMKYSVEHMRRHNDYNRGMIIWQLNDCWPVVSWSGIDYFGRWKAQQYYTKRFYADTLLSVEEKDNKVDLYVTSDGKPFCGKIVWSLLCGDKELSHGEEEAFVDSGESKLIKSLEFADLDKKNSFFVYELCGTAEQAPSALMFSLAKEHSFEKAEIAFEVSETDDAYLITVKSDKTAKCVMLDLKTADAVFSDNFFDLPSGRVRTVTVEKGATTAKDLRDFESQLFCKSLNEIMTEER